MALWKTLQKPRFCSSCLVSEFCDCLSKVRSQKTSGATGSCLISNDLPQGFCPNIPNNPKRVKDWNNLISDSLLERFFFCLIPSHSRSEKKRLLFNVVYISLMWMYTSMSQALEPTYATFAHCKKITSPVKEDRPAHNVFAFHPSNFGQLTTWINVILGEVETEQVSPAL